MEFQFSPMCRAAHVTKEVIERMGNGLARLAGMEVPNPTNEELSNREYTRVAYQFGIEHDAIAKHLQEKTNN